MPPKRRSKRPEAEEAPVKSSSVEHIQELRDKLSHLKGLIIKVEARLEERLRNTPRGSPD
jgi:hypothetical protein